MDERRLELKVGLFALGAIALGASIVVALMGLPGGSPLVLQADFAYAGGLPVGAVVKIAGVKVGRVKAVEFRPAARDADGKALPVRLHLAIDKEAGTALRADASATVGSQGALGESYLELLPGVSTAPLDATSPIRGLDPPRLDVLLARLFSVLESASNDEAFRSFLVQVAKLASTVDTFVNANRAELSQMFRDLSKTLEDGREAVQEVRIAARHASALLASPELKGTVSDLAAAAKAARTDLPPLLTEMRNLAGSLEKTAGALTPEDVAKVKTTLAKFENVAGQLQKVSTNADAILAGIQRGEGTAGKLVKDPKVYDELRALLSDIKAHPWKLVWKD